MSQPTLSTDWAGLDSVAAAVSGSVGSDGQGNGTCPVCGKPKFRFWMGREGRVIFYCHSGKCSARGEDSDWLNAAAVALTTAGVPRTALHWLAHQSAPQTRSVPDAATPAPNLPSPGALDAALDCLLARPKLLRLLSERVGLTTEHVVLAGIGWDEEQRRFWLPVNDQHDNLLTIIRRDFREELPAKRKKTLIWKGSSGAYLYAPFDVQPTGPVIVAAGERDCLALGALGMNAVCFTNGEGAVPSPERMVPLRGRDLVFAYDNDEGNHSKKVASGVLPYVASTCIVEWSADIPMRHDVSKILNDDRLGLDAIKAALAAAKPWGEAEISDGRIAEAAERIRLSRAATRLVDAEEAAKHLIVLPRMTLRQMMAVDRPAEPPLRIDRIHRVGHNTTITAEYKTGKTTFASNALQCLADGDVFLEEFPVLAPDGRIGFLNYELSDWDFLDWLDAINIRNVKKVAPLNLRGVPFSIAHERNQHELIEWCREMDVEVLFLDPHRRAFAGFGSENSNDDVNRFTDVLDMVKKEAQVQDLFLSVHTGRTKGEMGDERARGATALDDWTDNRLILTKGEDGARYCYAADGRTGRSIPEFKLVMDPVTKRLFSEDGNRRDGALDTYRPKILGCLEAAGADGANGRKLEDALGITKKGVLSGPLARMEQGGDIVRIAKGTAKVNYLPQFAPREGV